VKDDTELDSMLLKSALEDAAINAGTNPDAKKKDFIAKLSGKGLESLAAKYMEAMAMIRRWARRYDARVLEKMIYMPVLAPEDFADAEGLAKWAKALEERINADDGGGTRYVVSLHKDPAREVPSLKVTRVHHGLSTDKLIHREFFGSGEYKSIATLAEQLEGLMGEGAAVTRGDRSQPVASFKQAMQWLLDEAKRGQAIQRYKGLGEMNPEQLWETTMNMETRRLLKVKVDDARSADDVFTTLMGDQVEPRREFIEKNALEVANLDV